MSAFLDIQNPESQWPRFRQLFYFWRPPGRRRLASLKVGDLVKILHLTDPWEILDVRLTDLNEESLCGISDGVSVKFEKRHVLKVWRLGDWR